MEYGYLISLIFNLILVILFTTYLLVELQALFPEITNGAPPQRDDTDIINIRFYDVIKLMLVGGLLGSVLINLRGYFEAARDEENNRLPHYLCVPYMIRPFTGALCGLFAYFVLNIIVTAVTVEELSAVEIKFKGLITYLGIAMIAGVASQEFLERLKASATTLFGGIVNKPNQQKNDSTRSPASVGPAAARTQKSISQGTATNPPRRMLNRD